MFVLQEDLQKSDHLMNWSANLQVYRDVRRPDKCWRCVSERASKNSTLHFTESLKSNISLLVQNLHTISPQLAYRHAPLPSCPHSPDLTQSGHRARADRLLEGKPAPIWNIIGSEVQLQPAPVPVLFHLMSPGFWRFLTVKPRHT